MSYLPIDPLILIFVSTTLIATLLYLREFILRKKITTQEDQILQEFRVKGLDLLHQSMKKSQAILGNAELEGIKVLADTKFSASKLDQQLNAQIAEIVDKSQTAISQAQSQLILFLADLEKRGVEAQSLGQKNIEVRINQLFEGLENRLSDFLISTEQKTTSSIELELKSARGLIETYRQQQLQLIDENVLAMMEQTLSLVLNKKLSLKEQLDLVYEALEKAKAEKFIV